ncbi:DNA ligase D [Wenxinia marina]|uniref:DNA ligase (ATP) n=1 Tax=Wenxinia marina DSM 24838 TaxID=1123501 RepID=A0A0D0QA21_9RHOB|nr:DNA ligase D [Wenxinia marina]KIQ71289.1 ATP-dependent DNA ligase LigD phosphoesterase module/ATP-dependent DNA ligase LigD polymerase module [Wenxinia marina DSM 24838]GGL73594.1 ATP-dependent DNA ligase [Wenxinia marina]
MGALDRYIAKRNFDRTPEPMGGDTAPGPAPRYSIQKHDASRLHFDLRLEWEGVLLSWAITKGPSLKTSDKRLAVRTEDHPIDYLTFEDVIPEGYGAGTVMLWDVGHWQPLDPVPKGLKKGHLHFALHGQRLTGRWNLIRMKTDDKGDNWLLIKEDDEAAGRADPVRRWTKSVSTGRTMAQIGKGGDVVPPAERKGKAPGFAEPQLATLSRVAPRQVEGRWHELKFDGYRTLVALGEGGPKFWTRNGHDWSDRFAALIPWFDALPCDTALIDGEIVAGAGLHGFGTLQKVIKAGGPYTFHAFDLLSLDGKSLEKQPLKDRRAALEKLLKEVVPLGALQLSPLIEGDPVAPFEAVCGAGGEGLISKRIDAPYRHGRSDDWLKLKCERRDEFVVVGWQKSDKKGRLFASLALATYEQGELVYRGKVGTGWDAQTMDDVMAAMRPLARKTAPVEVERAEAKDVTWITPKLVAEIRYGEITGDGRLRHPAFMGLRQDKAADEVTAGNDIAEVREVTDRDRVEVAGVGVSSPGRVVYPKAKKTKLDVARYYEAIADRMLVETANRPLSLVRLPEGLEGERFFQKHAGKGWPDALKDVAIEESNGKTADYMYVTDAAGLVGAAQMGTIEFHLWPAHRDRLDRPDRMVFDLDPDEGLGFGEVKAAARDLRDRLADLGLESEAMVTGGKGVHVILPLRRTAGWDAVTLFSRTMATLLAEEEPKRFVATMSKEKRKGRIFIDWLRNDRGSTAVAPFSLRAREGAPVAVPVSWDELDGLDSASSFGMDEGLERDWPADRPAPQGLTAAVVEKLEASLRET